MSTDAHRSWARRPRNIAILAVLSVVVILGVTGAASSAPLSAGYPGVSIIAQNGFGDRNNSYSWSMAWFGGKLYVGTGRDEMCVEDETTEFYYPSSRAYTTNPAPNVRCPANPYDMSLQSEIWQYTPASATTTTTTTTTTGDGKTTTTTTTKAPSTSSWKMVYRSPLIKNPMAKGKMVAQSLAFRGMVVWHNPQGRQALFAAGVSPDEYLPPLLKSHPPVLLRSYDGIHWQTLQMPAVVVHYPGGNFAPMGYRSFVVWRNRLFVTATPDITGDGGLFEVTNPWSNHPGLRQVSGPGYDIFEVATFHGGLYIGIGSRESGYGVYRAFTYNPHGLLNFHPVVTDGAGRGDVVTSVVSMHVYRNRLYVGSSGWYNQNTIPASELIRIAPNAQWELVVGNPRNLPDGKTMYPVSGLYDGFFSPFQAHFWRMASQGGGLFLGTNDWAYAVAEDKQFAWLQETVLAGVLGFNLWATCDGNDWFAVTRDAFDDNEYNFGGRDVVTGGPQGQDLFIGTANQAQGTTIFDDQAESCGSLINGLERPSALMTNSLRHGTLLSWDRAPHASEYEIMQAPLSTITLGLKAPPTLPNHWQFDDAAPKVTAVGAPGSVSATLSLSGQFTEVGTTANPDFVVHSSGRYIYEVIARTGAGAASAPSNIEVTPFAGPPATFRALQSALGSPVASIARAGARGSAQSRLQSLLADAEAASAHGDREAARQDVARMQADAGDNDELAAVAARVARRLQYAGITGAP